MLIVIPLTGADVFSDDEQARGGCLNGCGGGMVQKWAVGAMINISGSIAINLGTNLMKLSHKVA